MRKQHDINLPEASTDTNTEGIEMPKMIVVVKFQLQQFGTNTLEGESESLSKSPKAYKEDLKN